MMKKRFNLACILSVLLACFCVYAAEPKPVLDYDFSGAVNGYVRDLAESKLDLKIGSGADIQDGALVLTPSEDSFAMADEAMFRKWSKGLRKNEISGCFWIRFDKGILSGGKNSDTASLGVLDCYLNKDNAICIKIFTKKTSLMRPVVMTSKFKAEYGKWYHVEFFYSMNERRVKLYVDGKFQMENDKLILPEPDLGMLKIGNGFRGAVKDLKLYDAALESEELAICDAVGKDYDDIIGNAQRLTKSANKHLATWAETLRKRAEKYKANSGKVSIAAYKRLVREVANATEIAAGFEAAPKETVSDQPVTVYVTPSTTQEIYLPDNLPRNGRLSNKIDILMAQDEFETASVIVVPLKPVKKFTMELTDLVNGKNVLRGKDADIKIVKRWFQSGGAWMTDHIDYYHRLLTPDLLVNDEKIITYDEFRRTNQMLMHYPGGDKYQEVSDFLYKNEWLEGHKCQFFYDAPTLQPAEFKEAGRNLQYMVTVHAPKGTAPGFYDGKLKLFADGSPAGVVNVTIRVLPFELPRPRTYCDSSKVYLSHVNAYNGNPVTLKNAMDHNMYHLNGVANTPDNIKLCKDLGYPLDIFFRNHNGTFTYPKFGGPEELMTPEIRKKLDLMAIADELEYERMFEKYSGLKDYVCYYRWTSEDSWYGNISLRADQPSTILHTYTHMQPFSHGMTRDLPYFSPGIYDMDSTTQDKEQDAGIWHTTGGRVISYNLSPSPENPGKIRHTTGLELYKTKRFDGHMMHGYVVSQYNQFAKYPDGDGDYRSYDMALIQRDGCINSIAVIGYREGFDDVRYASLMKMQAEKVLRESTDELVIREAKRQLAWLERVDGDAIDPDDFRTNVQYRIMVLAELIKQRQGKRH